MTHDEDQADPLCDIKEGEINMDICTCRGTPFMDSMCKSCLSLAEEKLTAKIEELQEEMSEMESSLELIQWHIANPICPNGCGENIAHCQCSDEEYQIEKG